MSKYEDDNEYLDGEERRPALFKVLLGILFLIILLIIIVSCTVRKKDTNNYLKTLDVRDGILEPAFSKEILNYNLKTDKDTVYISCSASSEKASTYGCNQTIYLKNRDNYSIRVKAQNGRYRTYKIEFNSKEEAVSSDIKVEITSTVKSGEEVEKEVELKAFVEPSNVQTSYTWYKDDVILVDEKESILTVSESGNYKVKVKDLSTNKEYTSSVFVVNVKEDSNKETNSNENKNTNNNSNNNNNNNSTNVSTLKINSITGNSTSWVSSVTLKVSAYSSSGLAPNAYSFDGGKTYQKSNTKTFTKNQTVTVVVKDKNGRIVSKTVTINKIDSTVPKVEVTASNKTNTSVVLTASVTPTNNSSGYKYQWYKNDNPISGATKKSYTATSDGYYRVRVSTGSGKATTSATYKFSIVKVSAPKIYAYDEAGKNVNPNTWVNGPIYIAINPGSDTVSYDIYFNETNNMNSVSKNFTYFNTLQGNKKLRVSNSGMRAVKIVVRDKFGNTDTYYSKVYYIK